MDTRTECGAWGRHRVCGSSEMPSYLVLPLFAMGAYCVGGDRSSERLSSVLGWDGLFAADRWDAGLAIMSPISLVLGPPAASRDSQIGKCITKSHLSLHGVRVCEVITSAAASLGFSVRATSQH